MRGGVTGTCRPPEREPASDGVVLRSPGVGQSEPRSVKQQSAKKSSIPGRCSQRCDPRLEYPHEELEWVFFDDHKIYEREEDTAVDDETHDHGYHVHSQLPGNHLQVSDGDDLSTDEASDTQRGVPAGRQVHVHCRSSSGRGKCKSSVTRASIGTTPTT